MHAPLMYTSNRNVAYFPPNSEGKDFVVGDVHGHFSLLETLLESAGFDPERDRCFLAGDLVDRGPESDRVVEFLMKSWCFAVRGNHDQWCVDAVFDKADSSHLYFGGAWFYGLSRQERTEIATRLADLPIAIETHTPSGQRIGIVHAECTLHSWPQFLLALAGGSPDHDPTYHAQAAIWSRKRFAKHDETPIAGVDRVYVGHNVCSVAMALGNTCYLDTGAATEGGYLTMIDITNPGQVHRISNDGSSDYMTMPLY